jgi:amidase
MASSSSSSRRYFLRTSGLAAASISLGPLLNGCATGGAPKTTASGINVEEITVAEIQAAMQSGRLTSASLVEIYLERIQALDRTGPTLRAVQEINPDALAIARSLDQERQAGRIRGPLHGVPVLLKDNIATADKMETTAGALALVGAKPREDSTIAAKMRAAGIVILGKASLSEWAYFKSQPGSSGWSARNGQAKNPYALDRTPCGSSSGSAIAVAANLVTVAIGTETDGSIICPSGVNGVVGIKPTVGLTSRAGVIPISATQDTIGPFGRTVADAAALLGPMTGVDPRDPATQASAGKAQTDYTQFLTPGGLKGVRIGVPRDGYFGYSQRADAAANQAIAVMREQGAVIVDPVKIPNFDRAALTASEIIVFLYELKAGVNAYLAGLQPGGQVRTLEDVIAFNKKNAAENLPYFGQEWLERSQAKGPLNEPEYLEALAKCKRLGGTEGFDVIMEQEKLDVLVAPTTTPAWTIDLVNGDTIRGSSGKSAALTGYPLISVPSGFTMGLPLGVTFMGRAWSEPTLINIAYAYEQATKARRPPQYRATAP